MKSREETKTSNVFDGMIGDEHASSHTSFICQSSCGGDGEDDWSA